jgi:pimeloyl-ACP methyl ester carboxylesterase
MEGAMSELTILEHRVSFYDSKHNEQVIVLLHGWGQSSELMSPIFEYFKQNYRVINIDFPGFGHSDDLKQVWGISDYTEFLHQFLNKLNIANPILIAHSFGARIALMFASKYPTKQMVLTGAAGIKPKLSLATKSKIRAYKVAKKIVSIPGLNRFEESIKRYFGSEDYRNTSGFKRHSFVKIVNEDLKPILPKINVPTLLIWGEQDEATPLWMGKMMEKLIPDAGLVIFEDDDHYAYFHQIKRFNHIVEVFISSSKEQK